MPSQIFPRSAQDMGRWTGYSEKVFCLVDTMDPSNQSQHVLWKTSKPRPRTDWKKQARDSGNRRALLQVDRKVEELFSRNWVRVHSIIIVFLFVFKDPHLSNVLIKDSVYSSRIWLMRPCIQMYRITVKRPRQFKRPPQVQVLHVVPWKLCEKLRCLIGGEGRQPERFFYHPDCLIILFGRRGKLTMTTSWVTLGRVFLRQVLVCLRRNLQRSCTVPGSQIHRKLESMNLQFASWNGAGSRG